MHKDTSLVTGTAVEGRYTFMVAKCQFWLSLSVYMTSHLRLRCKRFDVANLLYKRNIQNFLCWKERRQHLCFPALRNIFDVVRAIAHCADGPSDDGGESEYSHVSNVSLPL